MEYLKTIGDFEITSEKIDNYKPEWFFPVFIIGVLGMGITFLFVASQTLGFDGLPQNWKAVFYFIFVISATIFLATTMTYNNVCGISIQLKGTNVSYTSKFALSNDADSDAKKIKKIVDEYTRLANNHDAVQKEKEAEEKRLKQECCIRYKDVIEKVKTE